MNRLTGDDLIWNWARWTWSGATVGNMEVYVSWEDDHRPIITEHALIVEAMHATLPWHDRMMIIAEYPQKNAMFGHVDARARVKAAREWIANTTGVALTETEYKLYWDSFEARSKGGWREIRARGDGSDGSVAGAVVQGRGVGPPLHPGQAADCGGA